MSDFFEIDFLKIDASKSGDAITLRYRVNGATRIHVVDGGYQDTGQSVVDHINKHYDFPSFIDNVVATHQDGDHSGGLRTVLEEFEVGVLWMLRPWHYAGELIGRFARFTSVESLEERLKEIYPNLVALEEIAAEKGIPIEEPFQGSSIGYFNVMAPTKARYLDLIVESDKTPQASKGAHSATSGLGVMGKAITKVMNFIKAGWGEEIFSTEETSPENEMSVIQFAKLCDKKILLTADAGRSGLTEAADYAPRIGLELPGIDHFQVPHHGSRRNVSAEVLDRWLGKKLPLQLEKKAFSAFICAVKNDEHHPRKAIIRAIEHRGGGVHTTEKADKRTGHNAPDREGWSTATPELYPEEQEE